MAFDEASELSTLLTLVIMRVHMKEPGLAYAILDELQAFGLVVWTKDPKGEKYPPQVCILRDRDKLHEMVLKYSLTVVHGVKPETKGKKGSSEDVRIQWLYNYFLSMLKEAEKKSIPFAKYFDSFLPDKSPIPGVTFTNGTKRRIIPYLSEKVLPKALTAIARNLTARAIYPDPDNENGAENVRKALKRYKARTMPGSLMPH